MWLQGYDADQLVLNERANLLLGASTAHGGGLLGTAQLLGAVLALLHLLSRLLDRLCQPVLRMAKPDVIRPCPHFNVSA